VPPPARAPAYVTNPGAPARLSPAPAAPAAPAPAAAPPTAAPAAAPPRAPRASAEASAPSLAPARLLEYRGTLDREAFRILAPEIERGMQDALAARRQAMRGAPTVAAWQALLVEASPTLRAAGRVLERRTEVVRVDARVADPLESAATQRAAVAGLQAGLERILAQFGR
jgi:hypothetical protein